MIKEQIHTYLEQHKEEISSMLKELIKIPSVRGEAAEHTPFGKAVNDILLHTKRLYSENGFETELDMDGGYLLSYYGKGKKSLGLFAHADVVPANDDWTLTNPFEPTEKDNFIIGRGALDDKSAIVISLYCAKILRELHIPFESKLVMFTGGNEESGMADIKNYVKAHTPPDFSLVCDTAFPLYRGDKGTIRFVASCKEPMEKLTDFCGGTAFNITLGEVTARIGEREFHKKGISRHGALPEGSLNAAYLMAKELSDSELLSEHDREVMAFIERLLEKYYGEVYGIDNIDKDFGRLTVTNGIAVMENGKIELSFDMRYGASVNTETAKEKICHFFESNGWSVKFISESAAFVVPENDPYVAACLDTYREFTGRSDAKSEINAGGTYAKFLPRAVEIGTSLGGEAPSFSIPSGHGGVHQPDEYISIDGLLNAIEITVLMLLKCDKTEE